jgi:hypothetical protein
MPHSRYRAPSSTQDSDMGCSRSTGNHEARHRRGSLNLKRDNKQSGVDIQEKV